MPITIALPHPVKIAFVSEDGRAREFLTDHISLGNSTGDVVFANLLLGSVAGDELDSLIYGGSVLVVNWTTRVAPLFEVLHPVPVGAHSEGGKYDVFGCTYHVDGEGGHCKP
jgi:hypothetical protein